MVVMRGLTVGHGFLHNRGGRLRSSIIGFGGWAGCGVQWPSGSFCVTRLSTARSFLVPVQKHGPGLEGPCQSSSEVSQTSDERFQGDVTGPPSEGVEAKEEQRRGRERRGEKGRNFGYSKTEHAEATVPQLRKEAKEGCNEDP